MRQRALSIAMMLPGVLRRRFTRCYAALALHRAARWRVRYYYARYFTPPARARRRRWRAPLMRCCCYGDEYAARSRRPRVPRAMRDIAIIVQIRLLSAFFTRQRATRHYAACRHYFRRYMPRQHIYSVAAATRARAHTRCFRRTAELRAAMRARRQPARVPLLMRHGRCRHATRAMFMRAFIICIWRGSAIAPPPPPRCARRLPRGVSGVVPAPRFYAHTAAGARRFSF